MWKKLVKKIFVGSIGDILQYDFGAKEEFFVKQRHEKLQSSYMKRGNCTYEKSSQGVWHSSEQRKIESMLQFISHVKEELIPC